MSRPRWFRNFSALAFALAVGVPAAHAARAPAALIIAQGGLGDKSYNDLADAGFKRACAASKLVCKDVESKDVVAQAENILRTAAGPGGFGVIVDLEYSHGDALKKVAADYPKVDFAILNEVEPGANVASLLFKEQEGSYLAGALAAQVASDPKIKGVGPKPIIGVIGGIKSAGIDKFIVGYIQGAHAINPDCQVKVAYANNFGDPAIGLQMAKAMFDQGASVVYQVAGGTGIGVIQAAKQTGHFAIGVDTDQDGMAPGSVLTSMIKRTDIAVATVVADYAQGKFPGGRTVTFGLKENGVGLSPMTYTKNLVPAAYIAKVDELRKNILSGAIKVWDVTEQGYPAWFK